MAACETIEILANDTDLPSSLQIKDIDFALGPTIEWRTPPRDEMPFSFVYGQTPWKGLGIYEAASPVAACTGDLVNATFPQCAATAQDSVDGDVSSTIQIKNEEEGKCTPSVLATGLCPPGIHRFVFSAVDRDGNVGYADSPMEIEVVPDSWEESYRLNAVGDCRLLLDPRSPQSARVRSSAWPRTIFSFLPDTFACAPGGRRAHFGSTAFSNSA